MNVALILAGGTDSRFKMNIPKQFVNVNNRPVIVYTLEIFQRHPEIDEIIVSCLDGWQEMVRVYGKQFNITNAGQWYATMPADELADFLDKNPDVKKDWDTKVGDRMQKIVFIGQHLDRKAIEAELDKCLAE